MKHIDIRFRFVKRAQESGVIDAQCVNSQDQIADIFTKPLPLPKFQYLRKKLGIIDVAPYVEVEAYTTFTYVLSLVFGEHSNYPSLYIKAVQLFVLDSPSVVMYPSIESSVSV